MMDKHHDVGHVESLDSPRLTKGGKIKRHCKRFWWLHLIIAAVIAIVLTIALIYGIVPKVSQKSINDSTLDVSEISISNTTNTNFNFGINSTIHGHVPVKSHLSPQRMAMYMINDDGSEGKPFMYLNVSQLDLTDTIQLDIANYPMEITDMDAYIDFTSAALARPNVTLGVKSNPSVYVGKLHNKVNYKKQVTIQGFDGLKETRLSNLRFLTNQTDGANMEADVSIPNPSSFILEVGDLNMGFNGTVAGQVIHVGYGIVHNLTLHRGANNYKVRTFSPLPPAVIQLGLKGSTLTLYGNSTTRNGEHIKWLEVPLSQNNIVVPAPNIVT